MILLLFFFSPLFAYHHAILPVKLFITLKRVISVNFMQINLYLALVLDAQPKCDEQQIGRRLLGTRWPTRTDTAGNTNHQAPQVY